MAYLEAYTIAWLIYLVAAIGLYAVFCQVFKGNINSDLRSIVKLVVAAFLFTPAFNTFNGEFIAPALIMGAFELLSEGIVAGLKNLIPILGAIFVGMIVLTAHQFMKKDD